MGFESCFQEVKSSRVKRFAKLRSECKKFIHKKNESLNFVHLQNKPLLLIPHVKKGIP